MPYRDDDAADAPRNALSAGPAQDGPDSPLTAAVAARDREVMTMVRRAVQTRSVALAYQPVVQASAPDNTAFHEGLIRLLDAQGRVIPAREFIDTVETHELGRQIDCLALDLGLTALRDHPGLRLSINMSARSIGYPRWTETLRRGLQGVETVGERLILEITESSAMVMPDIVTAFMRDLQFRGIAFALDDFGAGMTSFRYLREFYFDIVKIDGQFIRGVAGSPDNQVLVSALTTIARHFDMFTVAESVETEDDAECCNGLGITCLQGYLYGAPALRPAWAEDARETA
jgi:EAL domain-containing protein (putative c-di-GMP-specific phosphodiesterase class I)